MKAFFIYRDGKPYGSPTGYTTEKGAKKSLVGCQDWYKVMRPYRSVFKKGEIFNQQVGSLYSGITADRINNLLTDLKENYGIDVPYHQPCPGRIDLSILDKLIKRYE